MYYYFYTIPLCFSLGFAGVPSTDFTFAIRWFSGSKHVGVGCMSVGVIPTPGSGVQSRMG
jgi:hypothetical protein